MTRGREALPGSVVAEQEPLAGSELRLESARFWALSPPPSLGAPHLARFSRDVGYRRPSPQTSCGLHNSTGVPYVRTSVARISYYAALATTTHAAFSQRSRMKLLNATNLDRKSGIRGPKMVGEAQPQPLVPDPTIYSLGTFYLPGSFGSHHFGDRNS